MESESGQSDITTIDPTRRIVKYLSKCLIELIKHAESIQYKNNKLVNYDISRTVDYDSDNEMDITEHNIKSEIKREGPIFVQIEKIKQCIVELLTICSQQNILIDYDTSKPHVSIYDAYDDSQRILVMNHLTLHIISIVENIYGCITFLKSGSGNSQQIKKIFSNTYKEIKSLPMRSDIIENMDSSFKSLTHKNEYNDSYNYLVEKLGVLRKFICKFNKIYTKKCGLDFITPEDSADDDSPKKKMKKKILEKTYIKPENNHVNVEKTPDTVFKIPETTENLSNMGNSTPTHSNEKRKMKKRKLNTNAENEIGESCKENISERDLLLSQLLNDTINEHMNSDIKKKHKKKKKPKNNSENKANPNLDKELTELINSANKNQTLNIEQNKTKNDKNNVPNNTTNHNLEKELTELINNANKNQTFNIEQNKTKNEKKNISKNETNHNLETKLTELINNANKNQTENEGNIVSNNKINQNLDKELTEMINNANEKRTLNIEQKKNENEEKNLSIKKPNIENNVKVSKKRKKNNKVDHTEKNTKKAKVINTETNCNEENKKVSNLSQEISYELNEDELNYLSNNRFLDDDENNVNIEAECNEDTIPQEILTAIGNGDIEIDYDKKDMEDFTKIIKENSLNEHEKFLYIQDLIEAANSKLTITEEKKEMLRNLKILVDWEVPPAHLYSNLSVGPKGEEKAYLEQIGVTITTGQFSTKESETIRKNWKDFCEKHDLEDDPTPFMSFIIDKEKLLPTEERRKFIQYIGRGLPHKGLYSIYRRFKTLFKPEVKSGRFSPDEDQLILTYLNKIKRKDNNQKFARLAPLLKRDRLQIERRYRTLRLATKESSKTIHWNLELKMKFLKHLLDETHSENIEDLREKPIDTNTFNLVGKLMNIAPSKLKIQWNFRLHSELFALEPINIDQIKYKLIKKFHELECDDWKTIDWDQIITSFNGFTKNYLWITLKNLINDHVPTDIHKSLKATIDHLYKNYLPIIEARKAEGKERFLPRLRFENGSLVNYK